MIHIPFVFDNNKNATAVNRLTNDYRPEHELEVQNPARFYQFHQIPTTTFQNDLSLESLDARCLNLQTQQLPTNNVGQNIFTTNFCSIDAATPHNLGQEEGSQPQSFSPNHSYISYHRDSLFEDRSTTLAQSLVPGPEVESSSQKITQVPVPDRNHHNIHHTGDAKVERASEPDNSPKHATKSSPPLSTQTSLPNLVNQKPPVYTKWTEREDELLRAAVSIYGPHKWSLVATNVPNRTPMQCSARWVGALNPSILKGRWTAQEDAVLTETVQQYINAVDSQNNPQPIPWNKISKRIPQRTGAQCQARWTEALDPHIKKGKWSPKEDEILKEGVGIYGRCWIRIAEMIDGRTQRQCRTRWLQIKNKQSKIKNETIIVTSETAAAAAATSNSTSNTVKKVNNNCNSNNDVLMLTPPTTTPSTPAQTMKNFSSPPSFVQSTPSQISSPFGSMNVPVTVPPHLPDVSDFNNIPAIIARTNSTSPEIYQSPIFSGPVTPAASPGNVTTTMTSFFPDDSNNDNSRRNSSYTETQSMIFQSPMPNPLCFYDGASYPFEQLPIDQIAYI